MACVAVALAGPGAGAAAAKHSTEPEPRCQGRTHGLDGSHFGTDNRQAEAEAGPYWGIAVCGTEPSADGRSLIGWYGPVYVATPAVTDYFGEPGGLDARCANPTYRLNGHTAYCSLPELYQQRYIGAGEIGFVSCPGSASLRGERCRYIDTRIQIYVDNARVKPYEPDPRCASSLVVQCLQAATEDDEHLFSILVMPCIEVPACAGVSHADNRYLIRVAPLRSMAGGTDYLTKVGEPGWTHYSDPHYNDIDLCAMAATMLGEYCSDDPSQWTFKNPRAGTYYCGYGADAGALFYAAGKGTLQGVVKSPDCFQVTWDEP